MITLATRIVKDVEYFDTFETDNVRVYNSGSKTKHDLYKRARNIYK